MNSDVQARPQSGQPPPRSVRRAGLITKLWFWIIVAIAAGIILGFAAPDVAVQMKWLADAFIQLIRMVAAPVISARSSLASPPSGTCAGSAGWGESRWVTSL